MQLSSPGKNTLFTRVALLLLPVIVFGHIAYTNESSGKGDLESVQKELQVLIDESSEEGSNVALESKTDSELEDAPGGSVEQVLAGDEVASAEPATPDTSAVLGANTAPSSLLRAQIALNEYSRGVSEATPGCNCGPRIDLYTGGDDSQWCAMFASWVFNQAGTPITSTGSWRIKNAQHIARILDQSGMWVSKQEAIDSNLSPQVGDLVVFYRGSQPGYLGHVDVVVGVSGVPGVVSTVGGNLSNQVMLRSNQDIYSNYGFLGFGRPS